MSKYSTYTEEVIVYQEKHCNWYNADAKHPCYGQVIKDMYWPNGLDGIAVSYYTCDGHYDCIEGGNYITEEEFYATR